MNEKLASDAKFYEDCGWLKPLRKIKMKEEKEPCDTNKMMKFSCSKCGIELKSGNLCVKCKELIVKNSKGIEPLD